MTRPLVLLVEDDPSIARFVAVALEELPIGLLVCGSVEDAWPVLQAHAVAMVITDLMLPGASGLDLLRQLRESSRADARALPVAVFSAGLSADVLQELQAARVFRVLSKPVSVVDLESCVREAVGLAAGEVQVPANAAGAVSLEVERHAIEAYFAGDEALFTAYKASCLAQFSNDIAQADAAVQGKDAPALRRVAHSLKSVLLTLGRDADSATARALEAAAASGDMTTAVSHWSGLRQRLG